MRGRAPARAVWVLGVVLVAGCSAGPPASTGGQTPTPSVAGSAPATPGQVAEDQRFQLDEVAVFPDGIEISTQGTEVRQATTTERGAEATGGQLVVVSILITNGTGTVYDPRSAVIAATYGTSGVTATMIIDSAAQLQSGFSAPIAPGDEATAPIGFAIPTAGLERVTFVVDPADDENEPVSFSGKIEKR